MSTLLVTGGTGFTGSAVIRYLIANSRENVVNVERLTYARNLESLASTVPASRYRFEQVDTGP